MVKIKDGILGTPKGKVGKMVYRHMNGDTFASERPDNYNASQSEAAKSNRGRFGMAIQFAKYVNSVPELSKIWKYAKIKGTTSFNKLVKHNIKAIHNGSYTVFNIITPGSGNGFVFFNEISFNKDSIKFKIKLDEEAKIPGVDYPILIFIVIALQEPKSPQEVLISFTHLYIETSQMQVLDHDDLELFLTDSQRSEAQKYKSCVIYLTAIVDSENPREMAYSSSHAESFDIL